jgi:uncharacterized damage-inducible protein DinB
MNVLSSDELLNFCAQETERWHSWFTDNPAAFDLPIDIAQAKTVRDLVLHIVAVELRYSERLLGEPITDYADLSTGSVDELFSTGQRASEKLRKFMDKADVAEWSQVLTFPTRTAGTLSVSKRKIFVHALLHGMRHLAQLASFLRQQGHKQPWQHDFIFSEVMP